MARVIGTGSSVALSPDGRTVVYVVSGAGPGLERRRLADVTGEPIRGTEGGSRPFFSPDGQWIGFFADGKLKRVSAAGGTPVVLADVPPNARATWGDDDTIVVARPGLMRLPASGGVLETILEAGDEVGQFYEAEFLPGARAVLVQNRRPPNAGVIEAVELATGERHPLLEGASPKTVAGGRSAVRARRQDLGDEVRRLAPGGRRHAGAAGGVGRVRRRRCRRGRICDVA